ncbi:hypothetical protein BDZ94DRAFT_1236037 [Collybia nuda]|uniref:Hydrophobin n=1 Tax=Collybia nuda TaxID=64659 RepID=A0A9P5Y7E6_9AGAR|nr:hypothetical protein BDZ94DRAFT_1236037 [Collybia nuda]
MFSKIFTALLAATAASAAALSNTPIPTTSLPKFKLSASDLGFSRARTTATNINLTPESALVDPTLILCSVADCASDCFRLTLLDAPQGVCLVPNSPASFLSLAIDNPDATVIPFAVLVGDCAVSLLQIPQSNVCFNIDPAGVDFAVVAGSTP